MENIFDRFTERAKKVLAVAVHNHYKRIEMKLDKNDVELQKSNILMVGPTGSGKSILVNAILGNVQVVSGQILYPFLD